MVDKAEDPSKQPSSAFENAQEFASHALYSCIQAPICGGYQLLDKSTGDYLPDWDAKRPKGDSLAAQAGDIAGTALLFYGVSKGIGNRFARYGLTETAMGTLSRQTLLRTAEAGSAGTILGLMQPVDNNQDYWSTKGKTTMQLTSTFAVMGGTSRVLEGTNMFGAAGTRTLTQSIGLHGLSGTVGGVTDSFAHAALFNGRLPTFGETATHAGQYAAFGAGLGTIGWGVPKAVEAFRARQLRLPELALSSEGAVVGEAALPNLKSFEPLHYPDAAPMSPKALKQSASYVRTGTITEPFEPGVKLATDVRSAGLRADGGSVVRSDKFMVIDRLHDPVLDHVLTDAQTRFASIGNNAEFTTAASKYVSKLFNGSNLSGPALEKAYTEMIMQSKGTTMPIGEFLRTGKGVCLQQSALLKLIGETRGLDVQLYEGAVQNGIPHVWTGAKVEPGKRLVYDPAKNLNGLEYSPVHYSRPKAVQDKPFNIPESGNVDLGRLMRETAPTDHVALINELTAKHPKVPMGSWMRLIEPADIPNFLRATETVFPGTAVQTARYLVDTRNLRPATPQSAPIDFAAWEKALAELQ